MKGDAVVADTDAAAMSSLVLASSAFGASALCAMAENALMTSGAPPRKLRSCALKTFVVSGQSSYMANLHLDSAEIISARHAPGFDLHQARQCRCPKPLRAL